MGTKQVRIVLTALIFIGILAVVVRLVSISPGQQKLTGTPLLTSEVIDKVIMRDREYETEINKIDGSWMVGPYPVVPERIEDFWEISGRIEGAGLIGQNPENHLLMGVSTANGTEVEYWNANELKAKYVIGDKEYAPLVEEEKPFWPWSAQVALCFVRLPERNEVYGIYCPFPNVYYANADRWRDPYIASMPKDKVASIKFQYKVSPFSLDKNEETWVVNLDGKKENADMEIVAELLSEVEYLVTSSFPTEEELKRLDFTNPDVTIQIVPVEGSGLNPITVYFIEREDEDFAYFVKNKSKTYVHYLKPDHSGLILKRMVDLLPAAEAISPTPTPTSGN